MIIRGTTPYHNFILPILSADIKEVYVTYLQNGQVIIDKSIDDVTITDLLELYENSSMDGLTEEEQGSCQLTVHLTQEDTLGFQFYPAARKNIAIIQIRLLTTDDEAFASEPVRERIFGVLHDGVIPDENEQGE